MRIEGTGKEMQSKRKDLDKKKGIQENRTREIEKRRREKKRCIE